MVCDSVCIIIYNDFGIQMIANPLKKKKNEKSKKIIKPTSLGREQNKSRGKLRIDQNQFKKVSNKLLLSVSVEHEERRPTHTYNKTTVEAEFRPKRNSPGLKKKGKTNQVQSGVFKTEFVRKRDSNSVLEGKKSSKERIGKPKKTRLVVMDDRNVGRTRSGLTFYPDVAEEIMMGFSSSDMFYSSNGESRDEVISKSFVGSKKVSFNELKKEEQLEMNVKCEYFKQQRAATKIQKIWKGFRTRQILDQFLKSEFDQLTMRKNQLSSNRNHSMSREEENQEPTQFYNTFVDMSLNLNHHHNNHASISHELSPEDLDEEDGQQEDGFSEPQFSQIEPNHCLGFEPRSHPREQEDPQPQNEQDQYYYDEDESDEDVSPFPGIPRQKAILSHQDLNQQLRELRQKQKYMGGDQSQGQEYNSYFNGYEPNETIMETNQEHIESRKNSMQNKGRSKKAMESSQRRVSTEGFNPANTINEEMEFPDPEADERDQRHQKTTFEYNEREEREDEQDSKNHFRTIELQDNSDKENYQRLVRNLKSEEIGRWKSIIEFIKKEVEGNRSSLMEILGNVVLISETNQRELESDDGSNSNLIQHPVHDYHKNACMVSTEESNKKPQPHPQLIETSIVEDKHLQSHQSQQSHQSSSKKKNLRLQLDDRNSFSLNEPMISKSKNSDFEMTKKLEEIVSPFEDNKQQLAKMHTVETMLARNQGFNSNAVQAIISLREDTLEEREKAEHNKLYDLFQNKKISEEEFNFMLLKLRKSAEDEREEIDRSKKEIEKALKVAAKVIAKAEKDAHMVGKRIGVSRSAESLRNHSKLNSFILLSKMGQGKEVPVFVDEGRPISNPRPSRNFFVNETDSNSDELDFTEEEYRSFNRPNISNEFAELNRNIIITQEFLRGEQMPEHNYQIEIPEHGSRYVDPRIEEYVNQVTEGIENRMMNEAAIELYKNPVIFETVSSKFDIQILRPRKVSKPQLNQFIEYISTHLPENVILQERLNQKICPPPLQLLKCMRVDLYPIEYDEDDNIQDVGKYEFIIPQAICGEAIHRCSTERAVPASSPRLDLIEGIEELDPQLCSQLQHRENFSKLKHQQLFGRSRQVYVSQMNCVFDCWNQQIIISKSEISGYSGIGLNEGSLSLEDQNKLVDQQDVLQYIDSAKNKLLKIINEDSLLKQKVRVENMAMEEICSNEGSWVCYTDEALGFILELDFVIFEEMLMEVARIIHKRVISTR